MKQPLIFIIILSLKLSAQSPDFIPFEYWRVSGFGMAFNVEVHDINRDGKPDIIVGNWNDTYVYFGGAGVLDSTVDVVYTGRMLAVCDYNGDGFKDMITMHLTNYDSSRFDYDGEILFYWGSDTTELAIDTIPGYSIPLPTLYPTREGFSVGVGKTGVETGDLNNDGKCDIIINSPSYPIQSTYGKVYIYMGDEIPPDTASYSIEGFLSPIQVLSYGNFFQISDINKDGYDDLLLSARIFTTIPNPKDSLDVLYIYMGNENFAFIYGEESFKYESLLKNSNYSYGWFNWIFSLLDVNGSGIPDLVINHYHKDSTNHVHFGSTNEIDTIPSFYITDPDTTNSDIIVGAVAHDIGDFNNDGYNDFILTPSYYKSFSLHLGGPRLSNRNPYGMRGLLEAHSTFPSKALNCDDQNGDGVKDFVATANPYSKDRLGYVLIFLGDPTIVTNVDIPVREKSVSFSLLQNYPNPFNPFTTIRYAIAGRQNVTMKVYDILGKEVVTLLNEEKDAGYYQIEFDPAKYNLASGVYFCELRLNNNISNKIKMIYLK
ncbi:MAG: FG-GAP-like repeat-containing protein [Ignavibacteria bacterium]|nr:FG-GAP-like repeat-containing protein [Ignavibacteria bacterium]